MSLTSLLDKREAPVRCFFEGRLPDLKGMQQRFRDLPAPTIQPAGEHPPWGYIGAAFDYRLRYFFAAHPARSVRRGQGRPSSAATRQHPPPSGTTG